MVNRGSAAFVDARPVEFGEQFVLIAGEPFAGMEVGVETADEGFIVGAEAGDDRREAGLDLLGVLGLEIVVQEDYGGEGKCFSGEVFEALLNVVVEDAEFGARKVCHQVACAVLHSDWQDHEIDVDP